MRIRIGQVRKFWKVGCLDDYSEAAYKVYRVAQTSAVSQTMVGFGQAMSKSG
jgi:hypothetical protein